MWTRYQRSLSLAGLLHCRQLRTVAAGEVSPPFKVDMHCHFLPRIISNMKDYTGYGGQWVQMIHNEQKENATVTPSEKVFRTIEKNCWSLEERIQDMDRTGVWMQVISPEPALFGYWARGEDIHYLCRYINDDITKAVAKYPKRFVGLGTLPLQTPDLAVQEIERCVKVLGMVGVEIGSHVDRWNWDLSKPEPAEPWDLDAPEFQCVFAAAEELGAVVFVHPWGMDQSPRMNKYWMPFLVGMPNETAIALCCMTMGGVLERFPRLKVYFAHGGGSFPYILGRITHGHAVRPDICAVKTPSSPRKFLGQIWTDSLVFNVEALKFLLDVVGEDRVMLGSDYPLALGEDHPGQLIESIEDMDDTTKEQILAGNALEFLGLDKP